MATNTITILFCEKKKLFVVIRKNAYPDKFTENSCQTCPDKRISTVYTK